MFYRIFLILFFISSTLLSQEALISDYNSSLPMSWRENFFYTLSLIKASENDITLSISLDKPLMLPVLKRILERPMYSVEYLRNISKHSDSANFEDLFLYFSKEFKQYYLDSTLYINENLSNNIVENFIVSNKLINNSYLTNIEKEFLLLYAKDLLKEDDILEDLNIYEEYYNSLMSLDSLDTLIEYLKKFNLLPYISAYEILNNIDDLLIIENNSPCPYSEGEIISWCETSYGPIIFGSTKANEYFVNSGIIIDYGGNDIYNFNQNIGKIIYIIDVSGDDKYISIEDFGAGGTFFGISVIIDSCGNDYYEGKYISIGSSIMGISTLLDIDGDDLYKGEVGVSGTSALGIGLQVDKSGNDIYIAKAYAQGCAGVMGVGVLIDSSGNDQYICGGIYPDNLRFSQRYLSFGQGFSIGIRPETAGGIGILIDKYGNDTYLSDVFSQAASYWYAFGGIFDKEGNDIYSASQYAQASGVHLAVATLLDQEGNDIYRSKSVSQGCGHDLAAGILIDEGGNDVFVAEDLAMGAGNANAWSIFINSAGDDKYIVNNFDNTMGWSDTRRGYRGSSIFLDLRGIDNYIGIGENNIIISRSTFGVFVDIEDSILIKD